jgi:REP element-mobilizing transposase RayT
MFSSGRTIQLRNRRLPHWTADQGTYFVTFRLADALSKDLALRIATRKRRSLLIQRFLDRGDGRCWLRDPQVAAMVDRSIRYFDGQRYRLHAWTIMPNHVHVVFRTLGAFTLSRVTHGWKSYTSLEANRILGRGGKFWQTESYDALLHDQHDLDRVIAYVVANPVKAGLTGWPWTTVRRTEFALV